MHFPTTILMHGMAGYLGTGALPLVSNARYEKRAGIAFRDMSCCHIVTQR